MDTAHGPDPARVAAIRDTHIDAFRSASLPLYGLDQQWTADRALGDSQYSYTMDHATSEIDHQNHEYGLVHTGDGAAAGPPSVEVVTSTPGTVADQPLSWVLLARVEGSDQQEDLEAAVTGHLLPGATESDVPISVDGQLETFRQVRRAANWVARLVRADHAITVQGRHISPDRVALVRITDLEPYVAGYRRRFGAGG